MCEDYPCCGHEAGGCNGGKYGRRKSIKAAAYARISESDYETHYDEEN